MSLRNFGLGVLLMGLLTTTVAASVQQELDSAAKQGKIAFILVTGQGASGTDQARDMVKQAMKQVKNSALVELDRSNLANADLVAKFRLAGAPVPLILVAARNGVLAGGLIAAQATVENLVAMVPSPKTGDILQVLQGGKAVLISVSRKGMATKSGTAAACAAACGQMKDQCSVVQIDMDDPAEAGFLSRLKVDRAATEPVTFVVNNQGQITGAYTGAPDVASLVQAANKKGGGCAPGACGPGSSTSCDPAKK